MILATSELRDLRVGSSPSRGLRAILGATSAEEACDVALAVAASTLESHHGFVVLENLGHFCDEAIPHTFIVRSASGTYPAALGELNPRVPLQRANRALHQAQRAGGNRITEADIGNVAELQ